jgi:hypothetical protein
MRLGRRIWGFGCGMCFRKRVFSAFFSFLTKGKFAPGIMNSFSIMNLV